MTQKIMLTRGLPASGKSTFAKEFLTKNPGWVRVERDMLRDTLFMTRSTTPEQENQLTKVQFAMAEAAILSGQNVIVSDMNVRAKYVRDWAAFASKLGAEFGTVRFDNISLDELIRRDNARENSVSESVLRDLWKKFTKNGKIAEIDVSKETSPGPIGELYVSDTTKPKAIMVDIDGTVAKMANRSPYEWHRVGEDTPVEAVIDAVRAAKRNGSTVIVMSGRDSACREITRNWLTDHLFGYWDFLYMRAEGDMRKDDVVKLELFNTYVRDSYNVMYVLDDRDQVVKMWRSIGLSCFQVAYGAF